MKLIDYLKNLIRNIQYLSRYRIETEIDNFKYELKDETLEDMLFQYNEDIQDYKSLYIADENETIKMILKNPKSFCRMGDGEIKLMCGMDQPFQRYDKRLAEMLLAILETYNSDIYVGINRAYFHSVLKCSEENKKYYRLYGTQYRRFFIEHCNTKNTYIDAGFATAYFRFNDSYNFEAHYNAMKDLFKNKKVLLVSGEGVFEKLRHNVFELARTLRIIHGPSKNAFDDFDELISLILNTAEKDEIICVILGMAGKAMVPILTNKGYLVWDIGHMAKDYDAYMNKIEKNHINTRSFYAPD